jgi:hypothetical protein
MDENTTPKKGWRFSVEELRAPLAALDIVGSVALLAIFGAYYLQARALPKPLNEIDIGAGGFPTLLAIGALIAIVGVGVAAVLRAFDPVPVSWVSVRRPAFVILAVIIMAAGAIWFEKLGTLPSVVLICLGTMLACGERRIVHLIGVPIALAAFIYVVFVLALSVNLP